MLSILDKYIIKKFLSTFFFTALIMTMVAMIIDFSERIDDFLEENVPINEIIFDYYVNWIPFMNAVLWPLYALISVVFFTSRMAGNSEIISILNSGASFNRIMRPYLIGATFLAGIQYVSNHYVIPNANKTKVAFENKYVAKHDKDSRFQDIHVFLDSTTKVFVRYYNKVDSIGHGFTMESIQNGKLVGKLHADIIRWKPETRVWELESYNLRKINGLKESFITGKLMDTTLNLLPSDFERRDNMKSTMGTDELLAFIEKERTRGSGSYISYRVERHRRNSDPFSIFILTIIGMAIAARKVRGGIGIHLAKGVVTGALFIVCMRLSMTLSTNSGLHPFLGAWIPNIMFAGVAWWFVRNAQK